MRQDAVLCVLEGTHSAAERTQVEMGEARRVRETRVFVQTGRRASSCDVVAAATNRSVRGYVAGHDPVQDISTEFFLLDPDPAERS